MILETWGLVWFGFYLGQSLVCDVDITCQGEQCEAVIVGPCDMRMAQCLNASVTFGAVTDRAPLEVLGCQNARNPRRFDFDADGEALRSTAVLGGRLRSGKVKPVDPPHVRKGKAKL